MSLNYTPSQKQRLPWLAQQIPDRRQRAVFGANLVVFASLGALAAATSRTQDWQPETVVIVLAVFAVASELLASRLPWANWTMTSTAPVAFTVCLLGPAPAAAISVLALTLAAVHERTRIPDVASNMAHYLVTAVSASLICRWVIDSAQLAPEDPAFALLVLGAYVYVSGLSFLLQIVYEVLAYRGSFWDEYRRERGRLISTEGLTGLLTLGTAYAYGNQGVEALGLLAVVQLGYQYQGRSLAISEQRARALQARADELAALHTTLTNQAQRLSELSASRGRLVGQVLQAEESERRKLAEALHDEALQDLLAARQALAGAEGEKAARARGAVERAVSQLRAEIFDLHPAVLDHIGLEAALQEVADLWAERAGFAVEVDIDPGACGFHDLLLFVLGREQIVNAAKHSGASEVALLLSRDEEAIMMEVIDDGRGMDRRRRARALEQGHIGLASSVERIEALGGSLEIDSAPGRGTRIRSTLPLRGAPGLPASTASGESADLRVGG